MPVEVKTTTEKNAAVADDHRDAKETAQPKGKRYHIRLIRPNSYMFRSTLVRRGDVIEVCARDRNYLVLERGNFEDYGDAPRGPAKMTPGDDITVTLVARRRTLEYDEDNEPLPPLPSRSKGASRVGQRRKAQRARRTSGAGSRVLNETTEYRGGREVEVE